MVHWKGDDFVANQKRYTRYCWPSLAALNLNAKPPQNLFPDLLRSSPEHNLTIATTDSPVTNILIVSSGTELAPSDDCRHNMVQNIRFDFHFSMRGRPNLDKTQTVGGGLNSKRTEQKNATSESLQCSFTLLRVLVLMPPHRNPPGT